MISTVMLYDVHTRTRFLRYIINTEVPSLSVDQIRQVKWCSAFANCTFFLLDGPCLP